MKTRKITIEIPEDLRIGQWMTDMYWWMKDSWGDDNFYFEDEQFYSSLELFNQWYEEKTTTKHIKKNSRSASSRVGKKSI